MCSEELKKEAGSEGSGLMRRLRKSANREKVEEAVGCERSTDLGSVLGAGICDRGGVVVVMLAMMVLISGFSDSLSVSRVFALGAWEVGVWRQPASTWHWVSVASIGSPRGLRELGGQRK